MVIVVGVIPETGDDGDGERVLVGILACMGVEVVDTMNRESSSNSSVRRYGFFESHASRFVSSMDAAHFLRMQS